LLAQQPTDDRELRFVITAIKDHPDPRARCRSRLQHRARRTRLEQ
jgi:hypothetical protein